MAHDHAAGIGPGGEFVIFAGVDLHLVLVEPVPEIGGGDVDAEVVAFRVIDGEGRIGAVLGLGLSDDWGDALAGEADPVRWQDGERLAVAVELFGGVGGGLRQAVGAGECAP